jgi:membrane associated rhomboid family serine protease
MFVPLHDENYLKSIRFQYVTAGLIALNVVVFLLQSAGLQDAAIASFAIIPAELLRTAGVNLDEIAAQQSIALPENLTLLSYMFFHGDIFHLGGNMLFLYVFGDNIEDAMGHVKYLFFYLACGIIAGLVHVFMMPASGNPLVGASGAVAGVIAAYLMLHPRVRVWVLALKFIPLRITAAAALGLWVLMQFAMVMIPQVGPIAWWAHIGGLAAGAILILFMRRPGVPLFDQGLASG